ncbi:unnamed protein product, partial [Mesorhabditis spiculigera]
MYPTIPSYDQWQIGKSKKKDLDTQFIASNTFMQVLQDLVGLQSRLDATISKEKDDNGSAEDAGFKYFDMLINNRIREGKPVPEKSK